MKIYTRTAFMELPEGVIYAKGKPWYFDGISVKGETLTDQNGKNIDFGCYHPMEIEAHDTGEECARHEDMLANGASYPMNSSGGRDGCFDDDEIFLVLELSDLINLKEIVTRAVAVSALVSSGKD